MADVKTRMNNWLTGWTAVAVGVVVAGSVRGGALPTMEEKPWLGYFAGHESRAYQFTVNSDGKMELMPKDEKGNLAGFHKGIKIAVSVVEKMPDGKEVERQPDPSSLTTTNKPLPKLEAVKWSGKVTGDAGFEVSVTLDGKVLRVGGRVTDPGKSKNPLVFRVRTSVTEPYKDADVLDKEFLRRIKDDEMRLAIIGGKPLKLEFDKTVDTTSEKVNGKEGLSALRFEMNAYKGRRFEFTAEDNSSLRLANKQPQALSDGFNIEWSPNAAKDPQGKSGFTIEVR